MRYVSLFFLVFNFAVAQAQQEEKYDTAKRLDPFHTSISDFYRNFSFKNATDSSLLFHQQYYAVKKNNVGIQDLGDMSTPYLNLLFTPNLNRGFVAGFNPFGQNYYYLENAKFYNAKLPYTQFYYTQGRGLTQQGLVSFDASHTQNIGKQFNIAANYHSTTNSGYYKRQTNAMKNLQLSSYYHSKNQRYLATAVLTYNKSNMMENGGLKQDSFTKAYFRELTSPVKFVDVELNNAKNINRLRQHQFSQTYWLVGKYTDDTLKTFIPQLGIRHALQLDKQTNYYTDGLSDYNSVIYDSLYYFNGNGSNDSMRYRNVSNFFEVFSPLRDNGISFTAGVRVDKFSYYQQASLNNYRLLIAHNTSVYGQINFNFLKTFNSQAYAQVYTTGYNQGDFFLNWKNEVQLFKKQKVKALIEVLSSARKPDYQQQFMMSNYYQWQNNFGQITTQMLSFGIDKDITKLSVYNAFNYGLPKKSFSAKVNYYLMSNYIYFDYNAAPTLGAPDQSIIQLYGMKHVNLRKFQLHQEIIYQVFSEKAKAQLLLPNFLSKTSMYWQFYAFKKATFLQIGTDINYVSNYTANFYNPVTRNFQRSTVQVGNYPFVDVFVNAEIKTAKIFFKMEHLNQDMAAMSNFKNYYYNSPYQPSSPRRFRLGIAWKFYY